MAITKYIQRFYLDGKLEKSSQPRNIETLRKWLDNAEHMWSAHLGPLTMPGEFDPNNGHEVTRVSADELLVTTTGGKQLRIINIERKGGK